MKTRRLPPLKTIIPFEVVGLMMIMAFFLPGGEDLFVFYRRLAEGCLSCGLNPWHTSWLLFPLRFVPLRLLWPVVVLLTGLCLLWACRSFGVNTIVVLLSFPAMGQIWLGQLDALVIAGLVLALTSKSPYLRGAGLLLASAKPQVSGVAILLLIWHDKTKAKTLLIPMLVLLATIIVWGIDWPIRWLEARNLQGVPVWGLATLYPTGLLAFAGVFLFKGKQEQVMIALLASALGVPWFGVYSYVVFLVLIGPWWALPLSYIWMAAYPWMGNRAMSLAWILPLGLLLYMVWPVIKSWCSKRKDMAASNEAV